MYGPCAAALLLLEVGTFSVNNVLQTGIPTTPAPDPEESIQFDKTRYLWFGSGRRLRLKQTFREKSYEF